MFSLLLYSLLSVPTALGIRTAQVYLHPSPLHFEKNELLSPSRANLVLSQHLGIESLQTIEHASDLEWWLQENSQTSFVGQGAKSAAVVLVNGGEHPHDFLPETFSSPSFTIKNSPSAEEYSSLLSTYANRAAHLFTSVIAPYGNERAGSHSKRQLDIFDLSPSSEIFMNEFSAIADYTDREQTTDSFAVFEINSLPLLASHFGRNSEVYQTSVKALKAALSNPVFQESNLAIILLPTTSVHEKRQQDEPQAPLPRQPNIPLFSSSTCHQTQAACTNGTNSCSGHGECVEISRAGRHCFTCVCAVTKDAKGRREWWAGEACQKKDISSQFVLLAGSTLFLLLLALVSVKLLYSIGNEELPGTLTGTIGSSKRD